LNELDLLRTPLILDFQPYLDSDMQSRWWDFGGNTIVRVDKYGSLGLWGIWPCADMKTLDTYGLRLIDRHKKDGSSLECH
jgi:hypothetical protein